MQCNLLLSRSGEEKRFDQLICQDTTVIPCFHHVILEVVAILILLVFFMVLGRKPLEQVQNA